MHFMDVAGKELSKVVGAAEAEQRRLTQSLSALSHSQASRAAPSISLVRLRALLELSLRSSAAASDPYKVSRGVHVYVALSGCVALKWGACVCLSWVYLCVLVRVSVDV